MNWNQFTVIHKQLKKSLIGNGFLHPTKVQEEVLNNYGSHKQFIVASQTGSGKTLAFAIPIISEILNNRDYYENKRQKQEVSCLILTPTRELALQIQQHLECIKGDLVLVTLVGGMAKEKQRRIVNQVPHILLATPGRLWDFIQNEENKVIENLNKIIFLVIDEADRMVELGHFPDLDNIIIKITSPSKVIHDKEQFVNFLKAKDNVDTFDIDKPVEMTYEEFLKMQNDIGQGKTIHLENNNDEEEEWEDEDIIDEDDEGNQIEQEDIDQEEQNVEEQEEYQEQGQEEQEQEQEEQEEQYEEQEEEEYDQQHQLYKPRLRTFLVSATLTQQFQSGSKFKFLKQSKEEKGNKEDKKLIKDMKNAVPKLQSLLGKLKIKEQPYIIDLTQELVFPEKLKLLKSFMEEEDKLLYLYTYIQQNQGQTFIIFLNSITYANKVTSLLDVLEVKSVSLHSHQQQRQRLKKLEKFKKREVTVLVCTDVAARGLDIVNVENVIHFQIPFNSDTFVHRCGRTARINKEGKSLLLIGPKDVVRFTQLEKDLNKNNMQVEDYKLNYKQIKESKELIRQAQELEKDNHIMIKKTNQKHSLMKQMQNEDVDIDERDLKKELEQLDEELQSKKRKLNNKTLQYQEIKQNQRSKFEPRFERRRNALFLSPQETLDLAEKLQRKKDQMKQQELLKQQRKEMKLKQKLK